MQVRRADYAYFMTRARCAPGLAGDDCEHFCILRCFLPLLFITLRELYFGTNLGASSLLADG